MTDVASRTDLVTLTIDGKEISVPKGTLVIRAAEQLGITIPRFCDHPLLDPVGACRQCMVEVEGQRKPFTSCTTTCTDGMVVSTHRTSEVAEVAQSGVLELLLVNHPLDCPQCDKGGECPLQDQALAHGREDSRLVDEKRRYRKPVPISALVALDRERCVLCARCTRFSQEISGDPFIELFERGALQQVAIYAEHPYESYFSGNVVQICPVGALTSVPYRFKARPFDLRSHNGVCNQCSAGCNLRVDERRGAIARQLASENMAVNEMWNCDKGRYGYGYVTHPDRLTQPTVRNELGQRLPASWAVAVRTAADGLKAALDDGGPGAVGMLVGQRLTDEDAYAASRFARDVLGTDNVDSRLDPHTDEERDVLAAVAGRVGATYEDVERAGVVVVAGLDPQEEVPILYLRLRKAWRKHQLRIVVVGPRIGGLADIAWRWVQTEVGGEAEALRALGAGGGSGRDDLGEVVDALDAAGGSAVVLAGERLSASPGALPAAAALATGRAARFSWVPRRTNARGAVDAGLVPGLLPGGRRVGEPGEVAQVWHRVPAEPGLDTRGILEAAAEGRIKALYLVGVDPLRDFPDAALAERALRAVDTLVVQDLVASDLTHAADVVLPAAAPQERVGSFTTWEGRRQPFAMAVASFGLVLPDWDILRQVATELGTDLGWETAVDVRREAAPLMEAAGPQLGATTSAAAPEGSADGADGAPALPDGDGPVFDAVVVDWLLGQGTLLKGAPELSHTARVAAVEVSAADAGEHGWSDGALVDVVGPAGRLTLPVRVTDAVVPGVVGLPRNSTAQPAGAIGDHGARLRVRLEPAAAGGES